MKIRLTTQWRRFWTYFSGGQGAGRVAAWLATIGTAPYYGRHRLARYHPRGFIAPSASVTHRQLKLGRNVYVGDRVFIYQMQDGGAVELDDGVAIYGDCTLVTSAGGRIKIGADTRMHFGCHFAAALSEIVIGTSTGISNNCAFYCHDHGVALGRHYRDQPPQSRGPIVVGNDVWLSHGVTVLSGVTIGDGAVIAAGAVVNKSIPANAIAAGVPARVIRYRE